MKRLSFADDLLELVISGTKTVTLRYQEDEHLEAGDVVQLVNQKNESLGYQLKIFSKDVILFSALTENDAQVHAKKNVEELKKKLLFFYPHLTANSKLTRLRFKILT